MKKLGKIFLTGLVVVSLAGCGKIATLENGEEAVVTTNDSGISASELYDELKTQYGNNVLIDMIDKLIFEKNYPSTSEEVAYINEQIASLKSSAESNNVTYTYLLNYYGFTNESDFKDYLSLSYKREQAVTDYLKDQLTDKEIEDYYNNNIFGDIQAKHILIAPSDSSDADASEALETAKEVIKKLDSGESWDELAKNYSTDSSNANNGGDLGWFSTGDMVAEFETSARALEKGTYSKTPVKTKYGYHIIFKTDEKDKPSLEDEKDNIKTTLTTNKLGADSTLYYSTLDAVRSAAGVSIQDDELAKDYKNYLNNVTTKTTTN